MESKYNWKGNKMERKTGEKVYIRNDLIEGICYGDDIVIDEMLEFLGKEVTIASGNDSIYLIEEDGQMWSWTEEMFDK